MDPLNFFTALLVFSVFVVMIAWVLFTLYDGNPKAVFKINMFVLSSIIFEIALMVIFIKDWF